MCPNGHTTKPQRVAALWGFCHSQLTNLRLVADYLFYLFFYPLSLSSISSISGMAEIPPRRSTHKLATALPTLPN